MAEYILPIRRLIEEFRRLPGVGAKTAARYAFAVLSLSDDEAARFSDAIISLKRDVHKCPICMGLSSSPDSCEICADLDRDRSVICVVENAKDVVVMEKVRGYRGLYHVLGGALSPLDNVTPDSLAIDELIARVESGEVAELLTVDLQGGIHGRHLQNVPPEPGQDGIQLLLGQISVCFLHRQNLVDGGLNLFDFPLRTGSE